MDIYDQAGHILHECLNFKGSAKALCLKSCVIRKGQTFALVTETLRYCKLVDKIIDNVIFAWTQSCTLVKKIKYFTSILRVLVYEVALGKGIQSPQGVARDVYKHRNEIKHTYEKYKNDPDLIPQNSTSCDEKAPINVRVNFLRENRTREYFIKKFEGEPNELFEDLFTISPNTSRSVHKLVKSGNLVIQSCPSCLPAHCVFDAITDFQNVIDACSSPGNKTTHLCALYAAQNSDKVAQKKLRVVAVEKDLERFETLRTRVRHLGASESVTCLNGDFLDFHWPSAEVIICDPSCSANRCIEIQRLTSLTSFQIRLLTHALLDFPRARCVSYSTCSANPMENELVVAMALELAHSFGWKLHLSIPSWGIRGEPLDANLWAQYAPICFPKERLNTDVSVPLVPSFFEKGDAAHCLRNTGLHPFFVAVFVRN